MRRSNAPAASLRLLALMMAGTVAACGGDEDTVRRAEVEIRGTNPMSGAPATVPEAAPARTGVAAAPDRRGVVSHDGYQSVVAREGDTVTELARRVDLSASELAAYNGLTPSHTLRAGDELVLPPRPGGYASEGTAVAAATSTPSLADSGGVPTPAAAIETAPLPGADATVVTVAPSQSSEASARGDSWSPDLAAAAIERSSGINADGTLGAPPSSAEPVPPEPTARRELDSPGLGQYQTGTIGSAEAPPVPDPEIAVAANPSPTAPAVRLRRPVEGPVAVGFNKGAGPARNDGVDFAAAAGAPVIAAADGEVALVSQSLGGLGTIVLLRHADELLTVYGRIDDVSVRKGDVVRAGQQIGTVSNAAAPAEPRMHFEVRRGAESLDPMQFL